MQVSKPSSASTQRHLSAPPAIPTTRAPARVGELPDDGAADRARGSRDHHRLAALWLADLVEPDIGGEPRHSEHAEGRRQGCLGRIELQETLARHRAVELPARATQNIVALAKGRVARALYLADDAALHDG